ncbi:MAG: hypothetical protein MJZ69_06950 [Bacteroidaceae bacterium]|nr:hypothetical protein [Candidatus Minthousia equi]MCQ2246506.1 hypothetical protein [Bacteroidaceae bacterium]MDO4956971.1 hypothetical protein [Bacteroidales bacterium]
MASVEDIQKAMVEGFTFKGGGGGSAKSGADKVKTKAKKKAYITGAHGSGSAKKKADIRAKRAARPHKGSK